MPKNLIIIVVFAIVAFGLKELYYQYSFNDAQHPLEDRSLINEVLLPLTPTIPATEVHAEKNPIIIDVRNSQEFDAAHIPGAINIYEPTLYTMIPNMYPDKNTTLYLYCNTGHSGAVSTRLMRLLGYKNSFSIQGGIAGWKAAGFPTLTSNQ